MWFPGKSDPGQGNAEKSHMLSQWKKWISVTKVNKTGDN